MKRILIVSHGIDSEHIRLQPWKYLWEVACGLARTGHSVTLLTNAQPKSELTNISVGNCQDNLAIHYLPSLNVRDKKGGSVLSYIKYKKPDVILWHVGKTSFLHEPYPHFPDIISVGIFTSPLYHPSELFGIGILGLIQNLSLSAVHLLSTFLPATIFRQAIRNAGFDWIITETEVTATRLIKDGYWMGPIRAIFPGVDQKWCAKQVEDVEPARIALGLPRTGTFIVYLGSPDPLRGLPALIKAFNAVRKNFPSTHLLILSREKYHKEVGFKAEEVSPGSGIWKIRGVLEVDQVIRAVNACDIVAQPFILVPSDAPLGILEAEALGKPIVTTQIGCLPELLARGKGCLAKPGDVASLATALEQVISEKENMQFPPFARTWEQVSSDWSCFLETL